jgi:iron complex transport system substrate-binding protein
MRIVSLLPAATEIVCALGFREQLVGVTHECDWPPSVTGLPRVTRTFIPADADSAEIDRLVRQSSRRALYDLDDALLRDLVPDVIVTQALCDVCAVAEEDVRALACALPRAPLVIDLRPGSLGEVFDAVRHTADALGVRDRGHDVVGRLQARVDAVVARSANRGSTPRVAFLEWLDPPFSSGHWTPELVCLAGGSDVLGRAGERSRTLGWTEVAESAADVAVIACCGFDVTRTLGGLPALARAPGWLELPAVRHGRVYVIDGAQYFSRPGPRLVDGLEILAHALHPDVHPLPAGLPAPYLVPQPEPAKLS